MSLKKDKYPWNSNSRLILATALIKFPGRLSNAYYVKVQRELTHILLPTPSLSDIIAERAVLRKCHSYLTRHIIPAYASKFDKNSFRLYLNGEDWELLQRKKSYKTNMGAYRLLKSGDISTHMKILHNIFGGFLEGTFDNDHVEHAVKGLDGRQATDSQLNNKKGSTNYSELVSQKDDFGFNLQSFQTKDAPNSKLARRDQIRSKRQNPLPQCSPQTSSKIDKPMTPKLRTRRNPARTKSESFDDLIKMRSSKPEKLGKFSTENVSLNLEMKPATTDLPMLEPTTKDFLVEDKNSQTNIDEANPHYLSPQMFTPSPKVHLEHIYPTPGQFDTQRSKYTQSFVQVGEMETSVQSYFPSLFEQVWSRLQILKVHKMGKDNFQITEKVLDHFSVNLTAFEVEFLASKMCLDDRRFLMALGNICFGTTI